MLYKAAPNYEEKRKYYRELKKCGRVIEENAYYINWESDDWNQVLCEDCMRKNGLIW